ncbi:Cerevisin [Gracilariopsis chorda]|uniref:Cerevisin n=1 Tax=Gracilariopsis chorda TaxID=448386 RepID=A0A2V3IR99_9FLOR|nr:Cerevisin [Gracilariopsis chorda]|eukprot:PXF44651.1 Cerevisin [Gracilariopsis chorda]
MSRSAFLPVSLAILLLLVVPIAAQPPPRAGDKIRGGFIVQLNGKCAGNCRGALQSALASNSDTRGCSLGPRGITIGDITFEDIKCPPAQGVEGSAIAAVLSPEAAANGVVETKVAQDLVVTAFNLPPDLWGVDETDGGVDISGGSPVRDMLRTCSANSNNGADVNVWILDTGCQTQNGGECYSYFGRSTRCRDRNGHGTHVGGTATDAVYGVAFEARRSCIKVLSDRGSGSYSTIINGIGYAVERRGQLPNGDVINMSLGGPFFEMLNVAIAEASALGVYFALAAGNEATNACRVSPASATGDRVFTVQAHDIDLNAASFTNFATSSDDCTDISAPGVDILSLGNVLIAAGSGRLSKEALGLTC